MNISPGAILVNGVSSGMGRACALLLAQAGYHVFAGVRKEQLVKEALLHLAPHVGYALILQALLHLKEISPTFNQDDHGLTPPEAFAVFDVVHQRSARKRGRPFLRLRDTSYYPGLATRRVNGLGASLSRTGSGCAISDAWGFVLVPCQASGAKWSNTQADQSGPAFSGRIQHSQSLASLSDADSPAGRGRLSRSISSLISY
jgi:hypothetical protein